MPPKSTSKSQAADQKAAADKAAVEAKAAEEKTAQAKAGSGREGDASAGDDAAAAQVKAAIEAAPSNERGSTGTVHLSADQPGAPQVPESLVAAPIEPAPARPELTGQFVFVSGPKKGRWRSVGGKAVNFGREPQPVEVDLLSADEAVAIRDDPTLSVTVAPRET